jgi:hypothetical protein
MEFEEDKGVFRLVDESNLRSSCSRKLLLQRRFGSLVVISDSSIVNCLFQVDLC